MADDKTNTDSSAGDKASPVDATAVVPKPLDEESGSMEGDSRTLSARDTRRNRILRIIWDSLDKEPAERAFINKADFFIMTYVCVAYFVKYLDQTNVSEGPLATHSKGSHD